MARSAENSTRRLVGAGRRVGTGVGGSTECPKSENVAFRLDLFLLLGRSRAVSHCLNDS